LVVMVPSPGGRVPSNEWGIALRIAEPVGILYLGGHDPSLLQGSLKGIVIISFVHISCICVKGRPWFGA
jgi:hypothetical protein